MRKKFFNCFFIIVINSLICINPKLCYSQEDVLKIPDVSYKARDKRDPFMDLLPKILPLEQKKEEQEDVVLPQLNIQGVFWGGKFPQAIINGRIVKEKETIDNVLILSIKREEIVILFSGRQFRIPTPATSSIQSFKGLEKDKKLFLENR
ncbi:MAG: hypothetical protein N2606_00805 [Candidatus Omnitrophica bacterium]|nr:hypothetical protein [Candidatus Omnitrophota bacterium]